MIIFFIASIIAIYVTTLFALSLMIKRNDIADVAWGPGIGIVALTSLYFNSHASWITYFITGAVVIWAIRLGIRIGLRNAKKTEDVRYGAWRKSWGKWFYIRSYFQIYLLQGFLMMIMGYPLIHLTLFNEPKLFTVFAIGLVMWLIGFLFEWTSDYQLDRFLSQPRAKNAIMQTGLWKYSRHPNYFGEVLLWWGIWISVASSPLGVLAIISPLLITFLILKVSGIPMLEKSFEDNEEFQKYKSRTSAFAPLPPKKLP